MYDENKSQIDLKLDVKSSRPSKTRRALYKELTQNDKVMEDEDYYDLSTPVPRGIAFVIDTFFTYVVVRLAMLLAPLETQALHVFFWDKYKLQFMFGEEYFLNTLEIMNIIVMIFFCIIMPVAFFNVSIGKKLTSLRIRGEHKYTLGVKQVIMRELFYKPIGILSIVGFVLPFYDKKKRSLHDKMTGTFVIRE